MAAPTMTFNAVGNIRASASLAASGTDSGNLDYSTKIEGQITVKVVFGAAVAATSGVKVEFFARYGSTAADTTIATFSYTIPATASATVSRTFYLGTGKWTWKLTNLDATNAVTIEITDATVDGIS